MVIPPTLLLFARPGRAGTRWQFLFPKATRPYGPTLEATLLGQAVNNVLPSRGGEVVRVVALNRTSGTSIVEATATVVVERLFDVLCLLGLLFVLAHWLPHVTWLRAAAVLAVVLTALTLVAAFVLFRWGDRPFRALLRPLARLPFLSESGSTRAAASIVRGARSLHDWRLAALASFSPRSRGSFSRRAPGCCSMASTCRTVSCSAFWSRSRPGSRSSFPPHRERSASSGGRARRAGGLRRPEGRRALVRDRAARGELVPVRHRRGRRGAMATVARAVVAWPADRSP